MHKAIAAFAPRTVILDPISSFMSAGTAHQVKAMLVRLFDWLKMQGVTGLVTYLTNSVTREETDVGISSLIDTWFQLRDIEMDGERTRGLYVVKSRGMGHSNQVREFIMSERGIELKDIYIGPSGMLTGSARVAQEAQERAQHVTRSEEIERQQLDLKRKHDALEGQIAALRAEFSAEEARIERIISHDLQREESLAQDEVEMGRSRKNDVAKTVRSVIPRNGGNGR